MSLIFFPFAPGNMFPLISHLMYVTITKRLYILEPVRLGTNELLWFADKKSSGPGCSKAG